MELACLYESWVDISCVFVIGKHVLRLIPWKFYIVVPMCKVVILGLVMMFSGNKC